MKKSEIKIGGVYVAKISGNLTTVKIKDENRFGGWTAVNTATGREVRIRTAGKLRRDVTPVRDSDFFDGRFIR